jgi:hypothetical protein
MHSSFKLKLKRHFKEDSLEARLGTCPYFQLLEVEEVKSLESPSIRIVFATQEDPISKNSHLKFSHR